MENNKNIRPYTTNLINGETAAYTLFAFISIFMLMSVKQLLKVFIGVPAAASALIAFAAVQIIFYLFERRFVFRKAVLSSDLKQLLLLLFRGAVNFGFYKMSDLLFGEALGMQSSFVWLTAISISFVFNYYFDRNLLFDCAYSVKSVSRSKIYTLFFKNRFVLFSMLTAAVCISIIYLIYTVFPFGDATVMRMDLYHQYGPLFAELYDRVVQGKSFLYSWTSGGGSSFLGNYFNYLSSPLSALIFLFDKEDVSYAISFLVAVKCVLSAGSFSYYLKKSLGSHNCFTAVFGVFYAFSAYFLAYYWNIMWLDGMILLPFIALGIERIINKGQGRTYIISLALLFFSSYYMAFMSCIFAVLYFIAYYCIKSRYAEVIDKGVEYDKKFSFKAISNRKFINRGFKFAVYSVTAAGLCAFTLIPVFLILRSSSATSDSFPTSFESYFNIFDFITSHLAGLETTIRSSGDDVLPNVYSGILAAVLLPLYVVNKDIRLKEKTCYILLMLFFLFSFDNNCLNFIWHAFHFPNDLPFRFSYMYSFILLTVGFKAVLKIKSLEIRDICFAGMAWVFFIVVAQKLSTTKMLETTIYFSIAFTILWTACLYLVKKGNIEKTVMSAIAVVICFSEVLVADTQAILITQDNASYKKNYGSYTQALNKIKEADDGFYRTELCYLETRMDPSYYGYNGISVFSSMAYENYSQLQYNLGMFGNRINSYTYNTQTPVYNLMFGIKYLLYSDIGITPSSSLYTYKFTTDDSSTEVYENNYYLPIAYCVNENIDLWNADEGNPFKIQSDFFELATGYGNVFREVEYTDTSYDNITGDSILQNGTYWFSKYDGESTYGYANITVSPTESGNVYLYVTSPDIKSLEIDGTSATHTQQLDEPYILNLGYYEKGEEIEISLDCGSAETTEFYADIYCYSVDENVLKNGYNRLSSGAVDISEYSDTSIKGTVTAEESCYLYSSIPYDDGWKIYIDGEEAETFEIGSAMLATAIKPGTHTVEYKYTLPGIRAGICVTAATAAMIAVWTGIRISSVRKKKAAGKNSPVKNQ